VKASRAYIAGLGTSGVLIASFLLLLAVVSAIVAFNGYPGEASNDGLERLDVRQIRDGAAVNRTTREARDAAGTRDRAGAHVVARGEREAGEGGRGGTVAGQRIEGGEAGGGAGGSHGSAPGSEGGGSGSGVPGLPVDQPGGGGLPRTPSSRTVTGGLGDAVENATGGVGETVGGAAPPLEAPVVDSGEVAGGVVEEAAPVVDGAVGGVTGEVGEVTGEVGEVTGGLTGGGD
jgi:hypothetical protein